MTEGDDVKAIADHPPNEMYAPGVEIDCQCARCGSSVDFERCEHCEDGLSGHDCGEDCCACLHPEDNVICDICDGTGVWHQCISSPEWCQTHPIQGREDVPRGKIEWFTFSEQEQSQ